MTVVMKAVVIEIAVMEVVGGEGGSSSDRDGSNGVVLEELAVSSSDDSSIGRASGQ